MANHSNYCFCISPGFKGNEWTAQNLQKKGYEFAYSVQADNKKEAANIYD